MVLKAFCKSLWGADGTEREPRVDWRQLPRQTATKTGWQCGKGAKNDSGKFVLLVNKTGNALGVCLCAQFYCVFLHSFKSFVFKIQNAPLSDFLPSSSAPCSMRQILFKRRMDMYFLQYNFSSWDFSEMCCRDSGGITSTDLSYYGQSHYPWLDLRRRLSQQASC